METFLFGCIIYNRPQKFCSCSPVFYLTGTSLHIFPSNKANKTFKIRNLFCIQLKFRWNRLSSGVSQLQMDKGKLIEVFSLIFHLCIAFNMWYLGVYLEITELHFNFCFKCFNYLLSRVCPTRCWSNSPRSGYAMWHSGQQ